MNKSIITALSATILAVGIAFSGFFIGYALANFKNFNRYVAVKGLAERTVKSDKGVWQLQFIYADDSLVNLYQGISQAQEKLKEFLIQQGFAANEIEIQPIAVTDNQSYGYSNANTNTKRYSATAGIVLTTYQVDKIKEATQKTGALIQQGVVISNSMLKYYFTGLNAIKPAMLDEATANARLAADSFARNSNSHLGSIRSASQGLFTISDESGLDIPGTGIIKKVRVVTSIEYFLKK